MANVILGLLLLRPMSLYDLVRAFEAGVSLFYSASPGSITRALGGLQSRALVEVDPVQPGTRGRKVYRPTPQGRAVFREWMLTEPAESDTDRGRSPARESPPAPRSHPPPPVRRWCGCRRRAQRRPPAARPPSPRRPPPRPRH